MRIQKNKLAAIAGLVLALAPAAQAATISYLGSDVDTHAAWRSTDVAKPAAFDPNGDNAYGTDGYHTFNGSGLVSALPSYITNLNDGPSTFSGGGYPDMDNPAATIGVAVADVDAGVFFGINTTNFNFELAEDSQFVLTVILGGNVTQNRPTGMTVLQTTGGGATATATSWTQSNPENDGTQEVDYLFFNVTGLAGDVFTIQPSGTPINAEAISGLAFEAVPEPSSDPEITSITSLGGGKFELTLKGAPDTSYEFYSSATLEFTSGGDLVPLTGIGTDVTTDVNGDATVEASLTGSTNFVRAVGGS
jgi:hypothetical protein